MQVKDIKPTDKIVTIEGLSPNGGHAVQKAWLALEVAAVRLLPGRPDHDGGGPAQEKPKPTDTDIDEAMTNICRCGTYQRIRAAIHMAAGNKQQG